MASPLTTANARYRGLARADNRIMSDFPTSTGDVFSAAFVDAFNTNPTTTLVDLGNSGFFGIPDFFQSEETLNAQQQEFEQQTGYLTQEEGREIVASNGYDIEVPTEGIQREQLDVLMQLSRDKARLRATMARANKSLGTSLTAFGASLAASLLDPLNIASAFIPVVGQARYGAMVARAGSRLGRIGVRTRVGAVEGVVGAAVVEPIVLFGQNALQQDYTMQDSLLNLALGGVLGGALHNLSLQGRGKVPKDFGQRPDIVSAASPAKQEGALRTSIAQGAGEFKVDVTPMFPTGSRANAMSGTALSTPDVLFGETNVKVPILQALNARSTLNKVTVARLDGINIEMNKISSEINSAIPDPRKRLADEEVDAVVTGVDDKVAAIDRQRARKDLDAGERRRLNREKKAILANDAPNTTARARMKALKEERTKIQNAEGGKVFERGVQTPMTPESWAVFHDINPEAYANEIDLSALQKVTREQASVGAKRFYDREVSEVSDALVVERSSALENEETLLTEALEDANNMAEAQGVDLGDHFKSFDEEIKRVKDIGKAAQMLAACRAR